MSANCEDGATGTYKFADGVQPLGYLVSVGGGHHGGIVVRVPKVNHLEQGQDDLASKEPLHLGPAAVCGGGSINVTISVTRNGGSAQPASATLNLFQRTMNGGSANSKCYIRDGAFDGNGQAVLMMSVAILKPFGQ
jgi:hypothetical protein